MTVLMQKRQCCKLHGAPEAAKKLPTLIARKIILPKLHAPRVGV